MNSESTSVLSVAARIIIPLVVIGGGVAGFMKFGRKEKPSALPPADTNGSLVETVAVESFDKPFLIEADGVAVPYRIVSVSSEVAGRIKWKADNALGGRLVREGDELFKLDDTEYALEVDQLAAEVLQAEEAIRAIDLDIQNTNELIQLAEEDLAIEDRNLKRIKDLIERGAGTEADVDAAERQRMTRRNSLQTLRNQVAAQQQQRRSLEASVMVSEVRKKKAELDLKRTTIEADLTGTVVGTDVEEGDYVSAGTPLIQISDSTKAEVRVDLRVDQLTWIWLQGRGTPHFESATEAGRLELPLTPVDVVFELAGSEVIWTGELSRYEGTGLEETTRTVPCRVLVKEPTEARLSSNNSSLPPIRPPALLRGMFVKIRIPIESDIPLLRFPRTAVRPGSRVYLMKNEQLTIQPVSIVREVGDDVLVRVDSTSLRPGDRVITSPLAAVREGMRLHETMDDPAVAEDRAEIADESGPSLELPDPDTDQPATAAPDGPRTQNARAAAEPELSGQPAG